MVWLFGGPDGVSYRQYFTQYVGTLIHVHHLLLITEPFLSEPHKYLN